MPNPKVIFYNNNLKDFVKNLKIGPEQKKFLISKIPQMDLGERIKLFKTLTKVYLLDLEEAGAIKRIDEFWKK